MMRNLTFKMESEVLRQLRNSQNKTSYDIWKGNDGVCCLEFGFVDPFPPIYSALDNLEKRGLVNKREIEICKGCRTDEYWITNKGRIYRVYRILRDFIHFPQK